MKKIEKKKSISTKQGSSRPVNKKKVCLLFTEDASNAVRECKLNAYETKTGCRKAVLLKNRLQIFF